mmetsp:Transcript_29194/g.93796  ORF Transcript_29194/g.93796 Transcript_29194/m.93796 type:complete len:222 (+) Transcript_29194:621-1286(+)
MPRDGGRGLLRDPPLAVRDLLLRDLRPPRLVRLHVRLLRAAGGATLPAAARLAAAPSLAVAAAAAPAARLPQAARRPKARRHCGRLRRPRLPGQRLRGVGLRPLASGLDERRPLRASCVCRGCLCLPPRPPRAVPRPPLPAARAARAAARRDPGRPPALARPLLARRRHARGGGGRALRRQGVQAIARQAAARGRGEPGVLQRDGRPRAAVQLLVDAQFSG